MDSKFTDDIQAFRKRRDARLAKRGLPPAYRLDILYQDAEENWITMNGTPVKVEEGQTAEEAGKAFAEKKESERGKSELQVGELDRRISDIDERIEQISSKGRFEITDQERREVRDLHEERRELNKQKSLEQKIEGAKATELEAAKYEAQRTQAIESKLNELVQKGIETGNEHLSLIGIDGAQVGYNDDGTPNGIGYTKDMQDTVWSSPPNSITVAHNHPANSPLSDSDFMNLAVPAVREVVAKGHDGSIYAIQRGSGQFPETQKEILGVWKRVNKAVTAKYDTMYSNGETTLDRAFTEHIAEVNEAVAKEFGWTFTRGN